MSTKETSKESLKSFVEKAYLSIGPTHNNPTDEERIIETLYWLYDVFCGSLSMGSVFGSLFIKISPCTREFAHKLEITKRFPKYTQVYYLAENEFTDTPPGLELRISAKYVNTGTIIDAYQVLRRKRGETDDPSR